jgi:hypothetical protein
LNFEDYDKRIPVSEIDWKKVVEIIKKHQLENAIAFQDFFTTDIATKDFVLKMYKIGINLSWNNGKPEGIEVLIEFFESYKK